MSDDFSAELRAAAKQLLPPGAFLRRDRGDAMFVTDAPWRADGADWRALFESAGFIFEIRGGLARLAPGPLWLRALAARYPHPPDFLCASLARFSGPPGDASLRLFARGAKALDAALPDPVFERLLRQRAAVCLRDPKQSGGGLYACALMLHLLQHSTQDDVMDVSP